MTYTNKIRRELAGAGSVGLTVSELARAVAHDANKVSALLAVLRKRGEVFLDGNRWVLGAGGIAAPAVEPAPQADWRLPTAAQRADALTGGDATEVDASQAVERAATSCRFWVYSDRCIGISDGDAVVELDADGLRRLIEFLAGVRPLLDVEVA